MEVAAPLSPKNCLASSESCEISNVEALLFLVSGLWAEGPCSSSSESSERSSVIGVLGSVSILEALSELDVERPLLDGTDCDNLEAAERVSFLVSDGSSGIGSLGCEWAVRGSRCRGATVAPMFRRRWKLCKAPEKVKRSVAVFLSL